MRHAYCSTNQLSEPPMMSEVRGERLQFKHREVVMVTVNVLPWWCPWEKVYWKGSVWLCVSIVSGLPSWVTHYPQASAASGGERQHCIHCVTHTHVYTHARDGPMRTNQTHTYSYTNLLLLAKPADLYPGHPQLTCPSPCDGDGGRRSEQCNDSGQVRTLITDP